MIFSNLVIGLSVVAATPSDINDTCTGGSDAESHHVHKQYDKRGNSVSGRCSFPHYEGMVAVQESGANGGWAMHYDQACSPGQWCPYACEPGQLMAQWDPEVTSYTYPGSQYGGLYCQEDGTLRTPFPDKGYCYAGKGTVVAANGCKGGGGVAFCQTVLPGNEEMLIPTVVSQQEEATLAVPGPEYWAGTAAHYYVNAPGVSAADACRWGDSSHACGNWAPYVAGANMDAAGNTFVKIGWNPVYLEESCPFRDVKPAFGVRVVCDSPGDCEGLPCAIDPGKCGVNELSSGPGTSGAGGGAFCVVTAKNHAKARIEVFDAGGDNTKAKRQLDLDAGTGTATTTVTEFVTVTVRS